MNRITMVKQFLPLFNRRKVQKISNRDFCLQRSSEVGPLYETKALFPRRGRPGFLRRLSLG